MIRLIYQHKGKEKGLVLPAGWDELTPKQLIKLAELLHAEEPAAQKLDKILLLLSGKSIFSFVRIPAEIRLNCFEHLEWIEKENLTLQLLPSYSGFYGPQSDFDNIILAEFHHAEIAYYNYTKTGSVDALNELVACLYRLPKSGYNKQLNKDGDIRRPYSYAETAYNKKKIAKWALPVKLAVVMWYDGCRQNLVKLYPAAFAGNDTTGNDYFNGLFKMIRSLSGDKYGTFNQVENMSLHTAFMEIVCSLEEMEELKRKNLIQ